MDHTSNEAALRRLDRLIWALVAGVAAVVLIAPLVSRFHIVWRTFAPPVSASLVLIALGWFYTCWRKDARIASGLASTAQVIVFAAVGAPLSYLAASANLPLVDHAFDALDHAMGLDWRALLAWMNDRPQLFEALRPIYLSLTLQMTAAVLCLAFTGRLIQLRVYTLAFVFAALLTIATSAMLPAAGAWPHYGLTAADSPHVLPTVSTSWPVFYGLRDGNFRALVAVGSEGIITFPSLHAALAVILIVALWPIRLLRWVILIVNSVMLAATPIDGSHYFTDVLAGIVVAILALLAARAAAAMARARSEREFAVARAEKIPQLVPGE
jgi:membrane-associated phospholipid phosphatase